jgi:hypothetical protein
MQQKLLYGLVAFAFVLAPVAIPSALLARQFHASLLDCGPRPGLMGVCDEMHYWSEIECFKEVGFSGGYFVVNERPAPAGWTHFGPHGPGFPVLYGLPARLFGWGPATGPLFNAGWLVLGGAAWMWLVRPGIGRLAAAALVLATFWPCLLYVPATLQESWHCAVALTLAGLAHRKLSGTDPRNTPFLALAAAAALVRVTWALAIVSWAVVAMAGEPRRWRLAALALVPALYLAYRSIASPYPNALEAFLAIAREQPSAACLAYAAHVDRNLAPFLSILFHPLPIFDPYTHLPYFQLILGQSLGTFERYQVVALLVVGAAVALRLSPCTRPAAPIVVVGALLVLAIKTDMQLVVGIVVAALGCWSRRAFMARPYWRWAACTAILGLMLTLQESPAVRILLGPRGLFGVYFLLLGSLCLIHRELVVAPLRRLGRATLAWPAGMRPCLFAWLNVALVVAVVVGLYDVKHDRDYRVLAPHLLLSIFVLVSGAAYRLGLGLAAVGLLAAPVFSDAFADLHHSRFVAHLEIDLRPFLRYDAGKSAWDNTLLVPDVAFAPNVTVPVGFGISTVAENEDHWANAAERRRVLAAPRSRYLLLRADEAAVCAAPLRLLYVTPHRNLYLNQREQGD